MSEISIEIGLRIRELRIAKGMSQDELAQRLGYKHRSSVNKIETGVHNLTQSKIKLIADILGVSPLYIMGWEELSQEHPLYKQMYTKGSTIDDGYYTNKETAEMQKEMCLHAMEHIENNDFEKFCVNEIEGRYRKDMQ